MKKNIWEVEAIKSPLTDKELIELADNLSDKDRLAIADCLSDKQLVDLVENRGIYYNSKKKLEEIQEYIRSQIDWIVETKEEESEYVNGAYDAFKNIQKKLSND